MSAAAFFARWRVRFGYPVAAVVLWLARPSPKSILVGMVVAAIGLWLRARAAGRLHKQEVLTTTGPYAYTRNPLYLGSFILTIGAAILLESALSFLGLGINPPTSTWGSLLNEGRDKLSNPSGIFYSLWPGFMILITVLSFNYIGDALRDAFDPRSLER